MALQDKIYAYFERDPRLRVLFVFDNDAALVLTNELQAIEWKPGYRFVVFDGLSWLGTKYALENEWSEEKVVIVFNQLSPMSTGSTETFPLSGLLAANAEYRIENYEQFMQHNGIPMEYATLVKKHMEEFDRDKYSKILSPYFNEHDFNPDVILRGLASGYIGETKLVSWDEILIKLIIWDADDYQSKKAESFYRQLQNHADVQDAFQKFIRNIFDLEIHIVTFHSRMKQVVESMKYNSIVQLLPVLDSDNYKSLRITDSLRLDKLNRLMDSIKNLPKQRREAFDKAFQKLSADVKESEILRVYGADADYYNVSPILADASIKVIAKDMLVSEPDKAIARLNVLRSKVGYFGDVLPSIEYSLTVAKFYEKTSRLGSVVYDTPNEYIERYTTDLYLFDSYYRTSIEQFHKLNDELSCYSTLELAKQALDSDYARIINRINSEWVRCLKEKGNGYNEVTNATRQEDFFSSIYHSNVKQAIIICDAFRYELAKLLIETFATKNSRYVPELKPGLAMLPTETKYCKSALLPHNNLEIHDLTLAVDNKILNDCSSREAHLKAYYPDAKVADFNEVLSGNKESLRQIFTNTKLVVLFYDEVDNVGHGNTPRKVVNTCSEAIEDLARIIAKIHDHGNVANVYLTSDHGFLYNDMKFEEKDKLDVIEDDLEKKSRYYLTKSSDANINGITKFPMANVSAMDAEVYVAVPNGTNRIKVRGGDYNFAHGGASLQEVIIPVLHTYAPKVNNKRATDVLLLGRNLSIVSSRLRVKLFQAEAVSETIKERKVSVAIYSVDTMVSNEVIKTLGSTNADQIQERTFDFDLTLRQSSSGILKLKVFDVDEDTSRINPLIVETVTDNTLIQADF